MPDLKTRLAALLIEFRHTRSRKSLDEITDLIQRLENPGDFQITRDFFLSDQSEHRDRMPLGEFPLQNA